MLRCNTTSVGAPAKRQNRAENPLHIVSGFGIDQCQMPTVQLRVAMIRHSAVFRLKHAQGSAAEADFLAALRTLKSIPGVAQFEVLRQVSPKCEFAFAVSMEFVDQAAYDAYNLHADHVAFVQGRWIPEVAAFTEIDYVPLA
jgi:Stress responsive A/B Barrel Domain